MLPKDTDLPQPLPDVMDVAGLRCHVYETSALEAWLAMQGLRQVICADKPPAQCGRIVHVVTQPPSPKEIDFILSQQVWGNFPSLDQFLAVHGIVGVTDFEVAATTDLPGWDGESIPVILSNPRWYRDGRLVPAHPAVVAPPASARNRPRLLGSGRHRRR